MTVIETAKLAGLDPEAYLADVLARMRDHDPAKLDALLPWNWSSRQPGTSKGRLATGTGRPVTHDHSGTEDRQKMGCDARRAQGRAVQVFSLGATA